MLERHARRRGMRSKSKREATRKILTDNKVFLFIIESPNPIDLLVKDRTEGRLLAAVAELVGHRAHYSLVRNEKQLREVCKYISTIDTRQEEKEERWAPLCIHISAHGNSEGLGIDGPNSVKGTMPWSILLDCLSPIFGEVEHLSETGCWCCPPAGRTNRPSRRRRENETTRISLTT